MSVAADSVRAGQIAAEAWLRALEFPRPNGTASLDSARAFLESSLTAAGLDPVSLPFQCHPDRALAVAVVLLLSALLLALTKWRRSRTLAILTLAFWIVAIGCGRGSFDFALPARAQASLRVSVDCAAAKRREVLLLAHYDTKTEPLDHVARTLLIAVALVSCSLAWAFLLRRRGPLTWLLPVALMALVGLAAQLALGRWLPARSSGIVDDAGACVLLADLATQLQHTPLQHTRVHFLWTSGEEVGAQGAAAMAQRAEIRAVDGFINLEGIGAGPDLADAGWEFGGWRLLRADAGIRTRLRRCAARHL